MSETMTIGEKAVWAAAYCSWIQSTRPYMPTEVSKIEEWITRQTAGAIEYASGLVKQMRDSLPGIEKGWENSEVTQMLKEMLGKE